MKVALTALQMGIGILLIIVILLQQKGAGLGAAFGAGGGGIESTRRGSDLVLYRATITLSVLFFVIALALVIL